MSAGMEEEWPEAVATVRSELPRRDVIDGLSFLSVPLCASFAPEEEEKEAE